MNPCVGSLGDLVNLSHLILEAATAVMTFVCFLIHLYVHLFHLILDNDMLLKNHTEANE